MTWGERSQPKAGKNSYVQIGEDFDTFQLRKQKFMYMYSFDPVTRSYFYYNDHPGPIVQAVREGRQFDTRTLSPERLVDGIWEKEMNDEVQYMGVTPRKEKPVEEVYKKTNYLTDDSDSDLDVMCDANKAQVPSGERPESLLDD